MEEAAQSPAGADGLFWLPYLMGERTPHLDATIRGGMGGLATIERLRNLDPQVTAIICSGYSDDAALSEFLAYGFRGALPKPFTRRELWRRPRGKHEPRSKQHRRTGARLEPQSR